MVDQTSPDDIAIWQKGDPASLMQMSATMAASVQDALNNRSRYNYVWDDAADRTAQTGMINGSAGYQIDTKGEYVYDGAQWVLRTLAAQSFTPTWINLTVGSGTVTGTVSVVAGWAMVMVTYLFGSGSAISGDVQMYAPSVAPISTTILGQGQVVAGGVNFWDTSLTTMWVGQALTDDFIGGSTVAGGGFYLRYHTGTSNVMAVLSASTPFTWASGDRISFNAHYPVG